MSTYIIVGFTPKNKESLQQYGASVPATLAKYAGKVLAKGPVEQLHGKSAFQMQVILNFPTKEDAYNWYQSPEYQALIETRNAGMDSQFQLVS